MTKERPILFSAPMVRALLDGSKTQTRRAMKKQPHEYWLPAGYDELHGFDKNGDLNPDKVIGWGAVNEDGDQGYCCPYGQPGDRLWVRETWRSTGDGGRADYLAPRDMQPHPVWYDADGAAPPDQCTGKTRVSIHMPRWASRILLEIVSVRVERLNDCSEADADAEGCERLDSERECRDWKLCPTCGGTRLHRELAPSGGVIEDVDCRDCDTYVKRYRHLWESINGAGSWAANPWVWVIEFERVAP